MGNTGLSADASAVLAARRTRSGSVTSFAYDAATGAPLWRRDGARVVRDLVVDGDRVLGAERTRVVRRAPTSARLRAG